jgi:hypothetical protein
MTTDLAEHPAAPTDQVVHGAEQIVLGALMDDRAALDRVAARLRPDQLYRIRHGEIYRHLLAAHAAGEPVDPVALARRLDAAGDLVRAGGASYLHDLVAAVPLAVHVDHYVGIILDAAHRRTLVEQAERLRYASGITDPDRRRQLVDEVTGHLTGQPTGERDSWTPLDLGPYLRGEITRPEPTIGVYRRDGIRFIYPGKEHSVIGEMESGKSWFALACVAAELNNGNTVVYIHFEESDPSDTVERLQALGVPDEAIAARFRFIAPDRPVTAAQIGRLVAEPTPTLVILDGVNEGMSLMGAAIREEDGVAQFRRAVITPFIRAGCAVLTCDHVVKDKESRGRYALGSIHKGNALSGALIVLENADPFGRGARGRSHIYVTKDRPGHLRKHGRATKTPGKTYVGELIVDDTRTHVSYLDLTILAPAEEKPATPDGDQAHELADAVHAVIAALPGGAVGSERDLLAQMRKAGWKVDDYRVRQAADDLVAHGRIEEYTGPRRAKGYRVLTAVEESSTGDPP